MCDSTQGSLCPSPMTIHQCMWIQWSILQNTTYIHTYTYILHVHTTYRMSDHIVSYWTQFRRDNLLWNLLLLMKPSDALQNGSFEQQQKNTKCTVGESQVCNLRTIHLSVLYCCTLLTTTPPYITTVIAGDFFLHNHSVLIQFHADNTLLQVVGLSWFVISCYVITDIYHENLVALHVWLLTLESSLLLSRLPSDTVVSSILPDASLTLHMHKGKVEYTGWVQILRNE